MHMHRMHILIIQISIYITCVLQVRTTIRNEWAHCNFTVWDDVKYVQSLQLIEHVIYLLNLSAVEKKRMIEELDKWRKNGN